MSSVKHDVVVIGGGNAGISVAARMLRKGKLDVAIVEPRDQHFFQPLFSHIAAGAAKMNEAVRPPAFCNAQAGAVDSEPSHPCSARGKHGAAGRWNAG